MKCVVIKVPSLLIKNYILYLHLKQLHLFPGNHIYVNI